jgi:hypothetical protein
VPNIPHTESLTVMINEYIKFIKKKKKSFNKFEHAQRVMKVLELIKRAL